jgi:P pilus assembly chaperone PapD
MSYFGGEMKRVGRLSFAELLIFAAFVLLPLELIAQISVSNVLVSFKGSDRPVQNVSVLNSANTPLYVTVTIEKVIEPGVENSPSESTDSLLVSPRRFSVPAKGNRTVRLLLKTRHPEKEELYRVLFSPEERGFRQDDRADDAQNTGTVLRVLTGMGILVFVEPPGGDVELSWQRVGGQLIVSNSGSVHARLLNGKACPGELDGKECIELPTRRVYGGKQLLVDVPSGYTVYYTFRRGTSGDYQNVVVPPHSKDEGSAQSSEQSAAERGLDAVEPEE